MIGQLTVEETSVGHAAQPHFSHGMLLLLSARTHQARLGHPHLAPGCSPAGVHPSRPRDGLRRQQAGGRQRTSTAARPAGLQGTAPSTQAASEPLWSMSKGPLGAPSHLSGLGRAGGDRPQSELKPITAPFQPGYLGKALLVSPDPFSS